MQNVYGQPFIYDSSSILVYNKGTIEISGNTQVTSGWITHVMKQLTN